MKEQEYLHKSVSLTSEDGKFTVTRVRTSTGYAAIRIDKGPVDGLRFVHDNDSDYEGQILELIKMLQQIVKDPCTLPAESEPDK